MRNKCVLFSVPALVILLVTLVFAPNAHAAPGTLVPAGSSWKYFIGVSEASTPDNNAWRAIGFNDSSWSTGTTPIGYGEAVATTIRESDSAPNWLSVYM